MFQNMNEIYHYVCERFLHSPLFPKLECFLYATTISSHPLATQSKGKRNKRE